MLRRWPALAGVIAASVLVAGSMPASGDDAVQSKAEALVATLDGQGQLVSVATRSVLRRQQGSSNVDEYEARDLTVTDGVIDTGAGKRALPLQVTATYEVDGKTVPYADLAGLTKGKTADVAVTYVVTNRTAKAQDVSYPDAVTGKTTKRTLVTTLPLRIDVQGPVLPDGQVGQLRTNGLTTRAADGKSTAIAWASTLAPPLYPGTATFQWSARLRDLPPPGASIRARVGLPDGLPSALATTIAKGGASTATLKGALTSFGSGFGSVHDGTAQMEQGVHALLDGLNNRGFDKAAYADDPTVAGNQPGVLEALQLFSDGTRKLKGGIGLIRQGLSTGDLASNPGVLEALQLLQGGIGHGLGTAAEQAAGTKYSEWDCSLPRDGKADDAAKGAPGAKPCGVAEAIAGKATPGTLMATLDTYKAVFAKLIAGGQAAADGAGALKDGAGQLQAGLGKIEGGLGQANAAAGKVKGGVDKVDGAVGQVKGGVDQAKGGVGQLQAGVGLLQGGVGQLAGGAGQVKSGLGDGTETSTAPNGAIVPGSLAAAITKVRAAAGNGAGKDWDCSLPRDGVGDDPATGGTGGSACGLAQAFTGASSPVTSFGTLQLFATLANQSAGGLPTIISSLQGLGVPAALITPLQQVLASVTVIGGGIGAADQFDCLPYDPVAPGAGSAGSATSSDVPARATAAQCNGTVPGAKPTTLLSGIAQLYGSLGVGNEFAGATPLTLMATINALRTGVDQLLGGLGQTGTGLTQVAGGLGSLDTGLAAISGGLGTGAPAEFAADGTPLTVAAALKALSAGIGTGTELGADGLPLTLSAAIKALQAGAGSAAAGAAAIGTGAGQIQSGLGSLADPASLVGALAALQAGLGDQEHFDCPPIHPRSVAEAPPVGASSTADPFKPGVCDATTSGAKPTSSMSGLAQVRTVLGQLETGVDTIVTNLGHLDHYDAAGTGRAEKAGQTTTRTASTGTKVEDPATVLYGMQGVEDGFAKVMAGFGSRTVPGASVLAGLTQVADGLSQVSAGAGTGSAGAATLGSIVEKSMVGSDIASATAQQGVLRASRYGTFTPAPTGAAGETLFVFDLPAAG